MAHKTLSELAYNVYMSWHTEHGIPTASIKCAYRLLCYLVFRGMLFAVLISFHQFNDLLETVNLSVSRKWVMIGSCLLSQGWLCVIASAWERQLVDRNTSILGGAVMGKNTHPHCVRQLPRHWMFKVLSFRKVLCCKCLLNKSISPFS